MAYSTLKAAIQAVIKQNGNNEITGPILQQALLSMINSLGDGYQFKGVATPATNPGTPDQNVFYIASEVGTYSNFGLSVGENEVAVFLWNGTWSKQSTGAASAEIVNQLGQKVDIDVDGIIYKDATIDTIGASSRIGVCMPIINKDKAYHLEVVNKAGIDLSVYVLDAKNYSSSHYLQKIYKDDDLNVNLDFAIDDAIKSQAAYIGIFYYTNPNNAPIYIKWFGYKDSLGESINALDNNVGDLKIEVDGGLKCVLEIDKSIGDNPDNTASYGIWTDISFKDYEAERGEPVVGTKYVSRVFDVRALAGKTLKLRIAPRANMYGCAFVTDYTKITTDDATEWGNIYVSGIFSSATINQDQEVIVPATANYLVVTCTDLDLPYAKLPGSLDERVTALEQGASGSGIIGLNNEVLTTSKILNAKRMGRSGNDPSGITPLMLLHFSDIHGAQTNLERIVEFLNHYKSIGGTPAIDDAICTGDMVSGTLADGMTFWNNVDGAEDILMCIGNHDAWANAQHDAVSKTDEYNAIIKPYVANWGVTQPANAETNGLCYFYKDYSASHIRLIVLDVYTHDDADYIDNQNTWLQSVLESARTAATPLSVLIACHQTAGAQNGFKCAFNSYQKGYSTSGIWPAFKASVAAFMTAGGDFIGWIGGHAHIDVCGVDSTYPQQVKIAVDAAAVTQGNLYSDTYRSTLQTNKSYDCFNLISIDVYQKTIKLIRIGADIDSWMRHKDMVTIQYGTTTANPIDAPMVITPYD